MVNEKKCSCKNKNNKKHEDMNYSEKILHLKECLNGVIERLECIKDIIEEIPVE